MSSTDKATSDRLKQAATGKTSVKDTPQSFPQMLTAYKGKIALALPKHISGDRMLRVALTAFRQNPKLGECEPQSVFAAVVIGAQLGLEPGILGQAYLVPYFDKKRKVNICQFIPGWQGLVDLVNRSGRASVWTGAVWKGDEFEYEYGSNPHIHHKPNPDGVDEHNLENLLYVYSVGRVKGAEYPVIDVQSNLKVRRHRDRYNKVGDAHYSYDNFEMYARKIPLMQILKYMPKSIEMQGALQMNYGADAGRAIVDIKDAIDGTFLPPASSDQDQPEPQPQGRIESNSVVSEQQAPPTDIPGAIAFLKASATVEDLSANWTAINAEFRRKGESLPIDVEAARNDRSEFIKARDEKARDK
jgi:recombination protein RecT